MGEQGIVFYQVDYVDMKGTIARLTDRGFGFIKPDNGDSDIFFHANALNGIAYEELREGDVVTFDMEDGPKGPAAANVARADASGAADASTDDGTATDGAE